MKLSSVIDKVNQTLQNVNKGGVKGVFYFTFLTTYIIKNLSNPLRGVSNDAPQGIVVL